MDNLTPAQRRRSMQRNTSSGTSPERTMRSLLRRNRLRFRSQWKKLPGVPDFVIPDNQIAIFVHGCFWHSHNCRPLRIPNTNKEYWVRKLARNVVRHRKIKQLLKQAGWIPVTVWECQLKRLTPKGFLRRISRRELA